MADAGDVASGTKCVAPNRRGSYRLAMRTRWLGLAVGLAAIGLAGCAGSEQLTAPTVPATTTGTATSTTDVPTSTTTVATAPATEPTTTPPTTPPDTVPPASGPPDTPVTIPADVELVDLVLWSSGIGPISFGASVDDVIQAITPLLTAPGTEPLSDVSMNYPATSENMHIDATGEEAFARAFGRTVCYDDGLCWHFGGDDADALVFLGWSQDASSSPIHPPLATADGISIGSRWSDHPGQIDVAADGNACYQVGFGTAGGIDVTLISDGEWFVTPQDDGTWVTAVPDPADVTVMALTAGSRPIYLYEDC